MSKLGMTLRAVVIGSILALASGTALAGTAPPTNGDINEDATGPVVPEPTAALVMAAGLGVVGLATRRHRRE
jgi:hypothetical protein